MVSVQIRADSDLPEDEVIGFDTEDELDDFVYNNPNTTQGGTPVNQMLARGAINRETDAAHAHNTHDTTQVMCSMSRKWAATRSWASRC
jgi:hypothetical protein